MKGQLLMFFFFIAAAIGSPMSAEIIYEEPIDYDSYVYDQPEQIHLSLSDEPNGMVITWNTQDSTDSNVEYGLAPTELDKKASGSSSVFISTPGSTRSQYIHRVELKDLAYNTTFFYHVGSNSGWSEIFWFKTFPEGTNWSPRFALYGDMGNVNAQSLPRLQRDTQEGLYDMVIHVGDFAYNLDTDDGQIGDEFMRQIEPIAGYLPYMTCVGNHEQAYNFSNYKARFNMPRDPKGENMFFSYNVGPVHFISISTEYYYFLNYGIHQAIRQFNWLKEDLTQANSPENRAKQPWIIVYGHRPMYCSDTDLDDCTSHTCKTRVGIPSLHILGMEDLLYDNKVDLAVWAHEHDYERFWPVYNTKIMNGSIEEPYTNPKAPVHVITGSAGCQERHDGWLPKPEITAFRSMDYGYTRLTVSNSTHLNIQQVSDDQDGKIIDDFWIINDRK